MAIQSSKSVGIFGAVIIFFVSGSGALARAPRSGARPAASLDPDKIIHYIRERFGVMDSVKLSIRPFADSEYAGFRSSTVTANDGQHSQTQNLMVSNDGRLLILGNVVKLGSDPQNEIVGAFREAFKVPATTNLTVGSITKSAFPEFYSATMVADNGPQKQSIDCLISLDKHWFVPKTNVFRLNVDLRRQALEVISTRNKPSAGPANAPVTIVEFADLECPLCAKMHAFLENEVLPRYSGKVRVVFKEYPLPFHDWSLTAAIANECSFEIDPSKFVAFRTLIFEHQADINVANVQGRVLDLGEQAGINRIQLEGCLDAKSSLPRIQQDQHEAQVLDVNSTPTFFINGRRIIGSLPQEAFYQVVDEALRDRPVRRVSAKR